MLNTIKISKAATFSTLSPAFRGDVGVFNREFMVSRTMGFTFIGKNRTEKIMLSSLQANMFRVNTKSMPAGGSSITESKGCVGIMAFMSNIKSFGNLTDKKFVRKTMDQNGTVPRNSTSTSTNISVPVASRLSCPQPMRRSRLTVYTLKEAILNGAQFSRHVPMLSHKTWDRNYGKVGL